MNGTPRALNRVLLGLIGLVFLAVGLLLLALALLPGVGRWWQDWTRPFTDHLVAFVADTRLSGSGGSWVWLVVALALVLVIILMIIWMAAQGRGRTGTLGRFGAGDDGEGAVSIASAVAEQALKAALADRPDLVGVTAATYLFRGEPALRLRVQPRHGTPPHVVAEDVRALVYALDEALGIRLPVLLRIDAGARTRFTRPERVR